MYLYVRRIVCVCVCVNVYVYVGVGVCVCVCVVFHSDDAVFTGHPLRNHRPYDMEEADATFGRFFTSINTFSLSFSLSHTHTPSV